MKGKNLVIGIYYHPEAYPPTLNAVGGLGNYFDSITVVHRPHLQGRWKYPSNTEAIASGKFMTSTEQEQSPTIRKVLFFLRFTLDLLRACSRKKPAVILLYDPIPVLAYRLIRPFLFFKHRVWYHNHDISEIGLQRKFSIGWFACRVEQKSFRLLDLFTLPNAERLNYFPLDRLKGKYFVIPNYPSLAFYGSFYKSDKSTDEIRLIFQGRIGKGHGFEEIIPLLKETPRGRSLSLTLKGYCDPAYRQQLERLAEEQGVSARLTFIGFTPYEDVPRIASTCHIGIGIFSAKEVMHLTLGTASNKLYEYAAVGLPVVYLNEEHFSKYLEPYDWAFGTDLTADSLRATLIRIIDDYERYSRSAHASFKNNLNFETHFEPVAKSFLA